MNLKEAIESGRPFRRPSFPANLWYSYANCSAMSRSDGEVYHPDCADICADDWEVQEPTVTITRTQLASAVLAMCAAYRNNSTFAGFSIGPDPLSFLAQRLGFRDD